MNNFQAYWSVELSWLDWPWPLPPNEVMIVVRR